MSDNLRWVTASGSGPEWGRSAAMADDGTVFVPGAIGDNETWVVLAAGYDNIPIVFDDDHLFVPARWLAKEFPGAVADLCVKIEQRVHQHFDAKNPRKE